ncbi:hypothetical protein JS533_007515 [Bifidobacterium amazonense]|uniref:Uncharacterized protein n=1 Tax=Bifidobacterium amazonense TaxID=2809027 RepID=A0ABS9VVI3_9BIFI|nr:hypothetical protein [Bifidobacterium amazonense]MCH9276117.1 hypothetical protein [Bifidobacterium amazonense]
MPYKTQEFTIDTYVCDLCGFIETAITNETADTDGYELLEDKGWHSTPPSIFDDRCRCYCPNCCANHQINSPNLCAECDTITYNDHAEGHLDGETWTCAACTAKLEEEYANS